MYEKTGREWARIEQIVRLHSGCVWYIYRLLSLAKSSSSIRSPFYTWTEHTLVLQIIITDGLLFSFCLVLFCSVLFSSVQLVTLNIWDLDRQHSIREICLCECGCFVAYSMEWNGATLEAKYVFYTSTHKHREHNCFKIESRGKESTASGLVNVSLSLQELNFACDTFTWWKHVEWWIAREFMMYNDVFILVINLSLLIPLSA